MSTRPDPICPPAAGPCPLPAVGSQQRSHPRLAALLAAAVPLATAAVLSAIPLAAAVPAVPVPADSHVAAIAGGDPCATTLTAGAYDTIKYPLCAGD
jgi:hypothetical protein